MNTDMGDNVQLPGPAVYCDMSWYIGTGTLMSTPIVDAPMIL